MTSLEKYYLDRIMALENEVFKVKNELAIITKKHNDLKKAFNRAVGSLTTSCKN